MDTEVPQETIWAVELVQNLHSRFDARQVRRRLISDNLRDGVVVYVIYSGEWRTVSAYLFLRGAIDYFLAPAGFGIVQCFLGKRVRPHFHMAHIPAHNTGSVEEQPLLA